MYVRDNVHAASGVTTGHPPKRHSTRDSIHLLAGPAAGLVDRMERLHALGSSSKVAAGLHSSAMCQWIVDLTYRLVKCSYAGIARVGNVAPSTGAAAIEPLAEAGHSSGDRRTWWAQVWSELFAERAERGAGARYVDRPLVFEPPTNGAALATPARHHRRACAVPLGLSSGDTALFAVETHGPAALELPAEVVTLVRAMASIAAMALDAAAFRPTRGAKETAALRASLHEMDDALSWVSHELKSPLTTIIGCLQLVGPKIESLQHQVPRTDGLGKALASIQDRLALAERYAEIEDRLATDLVDASRIRSAQMTLQPCSCELGQIAREAVDSQRVAAPRRIIHLAAPERELPIFADPDRIEQVVANLLGNAVKYSPADTPIEVEVQVRKSYARISVRDFGPGLERSDLRRVWQRFYRAGGCGGTARCTTGSGLGLGLYIAREIVRRHGGKVGVASVRGRGATFWFTLPLATAV